jgi:hypothetical protein
MHPNPKDRVIISPQIKSATNAVEAGASTKKRIGNAVKKEDANWHVVIQTVQST